MNNADDELINKLAVRLREELPYKLNVPDIAAMLVLQPQSVIDRMVEHYGIAPTLTVKDVGELLADLMMGELMKFVDHPEELITDCTGDPEVEKFAIQYLAEEYPQDLRTTRDLSASLRNAIVNHICKVL